MRIGGITIRVRWYLDDEERFQKKEYEIVDAFVRQVRENQQKNMEGAKKGTEERGGSF